MKKILNISLLALATIFTVACSDDDIVYLNQDGGDNLTGKTSIVLTAPTETSKTFLLDKATATEVAQKFTFTPANTSGTSVYYIEVTKATETFENGTAIGPFTSPEASLTVQQLEDLWVSNNYATDYRFRVVQDVILADDSTQKFYSPTLTVKMAGWVDLWAVGAALKNTGWAWDNPVDVSVNKGVGSATGVVFTTADSNPAFRFFAQEGWGPTSFNYPYYQNLGFTIDPKLTNANDGDKNFKYIGEDLKTYTVELDYMNKTITLK